MKTEAQIYEDVKLFIENNNDAKQLRNILLETIDNYSTDIYKNIWLDYVQPDQQ